MHSEIEILTKTVAYDIIQPKVVDNGLSPVDVIQMTSALSDELLAWMCEEPNPMLDEEFQDATSELEALLGIKFPSGVNPGSSS